MTNSNNGIDIDRRQILRRSFYLSIVVGLTPSCASVSDFVEESIYLAKNKSNKKSLQALEQQALRRIEEANKLITPYAGIPASNFTRAKRLYQANFPRNIRIANAQIWALSRLYWAELCLEDDYVSRQKTLPLIRKLLADADQTFSDSTREKVGIILANAGMSSALMDGDVKNAEYWYESSREFRDGFVNNPTNAALHKLDLIQHFSLGASIAASKNQPYAVWKNIELAQLQSVNAPSNNKSVGLSTNKSVENLLRKILNKYSAMVAINVSAADAHCIVSASKDGQIFHTITKLKTPNTRDFDKQTMELLIYGSTFREAFIRSGLGGWLGAYAATNSSGSLSTSNVFIDKIDGISMHHWSYFVATIKQQLANIGINSTAKVAMILPDDLAILPIRAAKNSTSGTEFLDYYSISQIPGVASLARVLEKPQNVKMEFSALINPTGDLKNTLLEKDYLVRSLGAKANDIRAGLTAKKFINLLQQQNARYIYISTHGQTLVEDKDENGLFLGNNQFLRAQDVYNAKGSIEADLVILSACEVGLASRSLNPEPSNLASAFLSKGAGGVISPLWRVEVNSTALLMCKLLEQIVNDNTEPAIALTKAQMWLRDSSADDFKLFLLGLLGTYPSSATHSIENILTALSNYRGSDKPYSNTYYWGAFFYMGA